MLCSLSVENYALIDRLEMTLGPGLNIVTGETGAGKSIVLGALGLLLGTRGEAGVQKDPSRACVVEGVFDLEGFGFEGFFAERDLDYAPLTVVRRVISTSGKSRAYVGDLPVGLAVLRELGERLIDIHSQHENLLLRDDAFRVSILDGAAGQGALVKRYGEVFSAWRAVLKRLSAAQAAGRDARRDEEWLRHQTAELAGMRLRAGEQAELEAEQSELSHSDLLRETFGQAASGLGADETGVVVLLKGLRTALERVEGIHAGAGGFAGRIASAHLDMQDLEREIAAEYERVEGNPERLAAVVERLDAIYGLQQKHRVGTIEELLDIQARFEEQLGAIEHGDEQVAALEREAAALGGEAGKLAARISSARREAAPKVSHSVVEMLRRLGMAEAGLEVEVSDLGELKPNGRDEVRFLFTANSSVQPRPIEKIASGGEISRVMLALKTLSARSAGQITVIFDEIDAGVSGRVADAMGEVIAELGRHCQVLNITHLPQIAAKQGEHFLVYKQGGATHIRPLSTEERVAEIAGLLSGSTVTAAAIRQARELLGVGTDTTKTIQNG
jgi:DNA repair protein RecN (Recombination protein N)